jgi:hypothetical protein
MQICSISFEFDFDFITPDHTYNVNYTISDIYSLIICLEILEIF